MTAGPTGMTPTQVRHAYGIDQITFSSGTVAGNGAGMTIAIVDAYDDPNIGDDLRKFNAAFGLPNSGFTKVNQNGGTTYPAADKGWAGEIALDVEWAHAIAPLANILLVEAFDNSWANLSAAVQYAARQPGVVAVSMSWGGGEFPGEQTFDSTFTTPAGHAGVTFVASSGDTGAPASYPAVSPNVLSVGGTTLTLNASGNIASETAWGGSGGGISTQEEQPSYQRGIVTQTTTRRGNPDVAYNANPNTGFAVYDSYSNGSTTPWSQYGGTSAGAPQWAAIIAIADQGRSLSGLSSLDGRSQTLPMLYSFAASDFNDITSGTSNGSTTISAGVGYDLVTGRGSPKANLVVRDLVGQSTTPQSSVHFAVTGISSTTAGSPFSITVTALDVNNNVITGYTGKVHLTTDDTKGILPADYTFTAADKGIHRFADALSLKTAGGHSVTVKDAANSSYSGAFTITVNAAAAKQLVFVQQPTNATLGSAIQPGVKVNVLDAYGNLVTQDNSDKVTITFAANSAGASLSGTTTVQVVAGVATFNNLVVNKAGTGFKLQGASGTLTAAISTAFNVTGPTWSVVEGFEKSSTWNVVGSSVTARITTSATHDGVYGLDDVGGNDWLYRQDDAVRVSQGDSVATWLKFSGTANGKAYFGFGSSAIGTYSIVASGESKQFQIQLNSGYQSSTIVASTDFTFAANHWYKVQVDWSTSGTMVAKLYDTNGTSLLKSVSGTSTTYASGGIGFKGTGSDKFFDSVSVIHGVNVVATTKPAVASFSLSAMVTSTGFTGNVTTPTTSANTYSNTSSISSHSLSSTRVDQYFSSGDDHHEFADDSDSGVSSKNNSNRVVSTSTIRRARG
ncbi:S53 family peptidase [bacterium]|nr:S53 family peptidase [bacterium]